MIYYDTETVGFTGPAVLIQYALDDGEVVLHDVWKRPVRETLELIEWMMNHPGGVCGFNLVFDHFHLCRLHTTLLLARDKDAVPDVKEFWDNEAQAIFGPCLKPTSALDLMLVARKGKYQNVMERDDVRIRKVPLSLAPALADELTRRVDLDELYFKRRKGRRWSVYEEDRPADAGPNWKPEWADVVLKFGASGALKPLIEHITGETTLDYPAPKELSPNEEGWCPVGSRLAAVGYTGLWDTKIEAQIRFWGTNATAREYARQDVDHLRTLREHLEWPAAGDDDSELACCVGAVRWRGFEIDVEGAVLLLETAVERSLSVPTDPRRALQLLHENMNATERLAITDTTAETLEVVMGWHNHPACDVARAVSEARRAEKEVDQLVKLLTAGRFHPDFKVTGTRSNRMSGAGGFNAQGVIREHKIRSLFTMAKRGEQLSGGDFDAFEVSIAAAAYDDEQLNADLAGGKSVHGGIFGSWLYEMSYDAIVETKGTKDDKYTKAKNTWFGWVYGAHDERMATTAGVLVEKATVARKNLFERYPGIDQERQRIHDMFCSMRQPGGIGTKIIWHEPADYIESLLGFRRYFTLENYICKALFDLAQDPPLSLREARVNVRRRDRVQTAGGAVQSALYACAFQIQARNLRAAGNHVIQSTGAQICKRVQRRVWDIQPRGIHTWLVQPMNVHDEVESVHQEGLGEHVRKVALDAVEEFRKCIPFIALSWKVGLPNWSGK